MADSGLDLLFRLKASNQATPAIKSVQADVAKLRQTFGSDFNQMKAVSTTAISSITSSFSGLTGRVPVLGGVLNSLTSELTATAGATTQTGASLAALGGPLGIAIAGIAATVVGVAALTKGLFELAQHTADYQGKLFDMSQQTGVAVETLSALEIVAKTTGGSIESISQSLVIFQGHLDEAQDSSSKAGKQFQELGISVEDTETAFRDALKSLAAMPEGFHQTNEAAELFGRRGGKQVLAILKELDGDLDGAIGKFKEFGLVTTDEAKAADEFNDQLTLLQFQLRGLSGVIGKEVIPQALSALKDLQQALKDNKDAIDALGLAARITSGAIGLPLKGALFLVTEQIKAQLPLLQQLVNAYEKVALAAQKIRGAAPAVKGGVDFGGGVDGLKLLQEAQTAFQASLKPVDLQEIFGTKAAKSAAKDLRAALEEQLAVIRDAISDRTAAFQFESEDLQRELIKRQIAFDAYIKKARDANDNLLASTLANLQKERDAVNAALASKVINANEAAKKLRAIDNAVTQARREAQREQQRLDDAAEDRKRKQLLATADVQRATIEALSRISEITDANRIATIRFQAEARVKSEAEAERQILAIRLAALDREKDVLETQVKTTVSIEDPEEQLKARAALNLQLSVLAAERNAIENQAMRDIDEARKKDLESTRLYFDELEEINQGIKDIQRDTAEEVIRSMIQHFARRTDIIRAQADLDIRDAEDRHSRNQADISRQKATVRERIASIDSQIKSLESVGKRESEIYENAVNARISALSQQDQLNDRERASLTQHQAILTALRSQNVIQDYQRAIAARVVALEKQKDLNAEEQEELRQHQAILRSLRERDTRSDRAGIIQARILVLQQQRDLNQEEKAELQKHQAELKQIREQDVDLQSVIQKRIDFLRAQTVLNEGERAELARHEATLKIIRGTGQSFESALRARIKFLEAQETLNAQELEELKQNRKLVAAIEDRSDIYKKAIEQRILFLEQQKALNDQEIAELERLRLEKKRIEDKEKKDKKDASPTGRITLDIDDLKEFAKVIEESIVPLGDILTNTFLQVADAIGQTVANWVLLGETGPAVMRKILAQALASIAAEAAVNAIKELALGFASLFYNPAESAAHFTAAALWGSIAGVAAVAGRAVAGDLFKKKDSDKGSSSKGSPDALQTIIQGRNQAPNINVTINMKGDDSKLASFITASVVRNIGDGGEIREVIQTDSRG